MNQYLPSILNFTQGHQDSISLEIFFKALLQLPKLPFSLHLHIYSKSLLRALKPFQCHLHTNSTNIDIPFEISFFHQSLFIHFTDSLLTQNPSYTQTIASLISALVFQEKRLTQNKNFYLINLPSSKDQFFFRGKNLLGHTEFFREYFQKTIHMCFLSKHYNVLLLTDHLSLKDAQQEFKKPSSRFFSSQYLKSILEEFTVYGRNDINRLLLMGLNPHAGEGGKLGNEDIEFSKWFKKEIIYSDPILKQKFSQSVYSEIACDSLHHRKLSQNDLLVFPTHDQALIFFKILSGFNGFQFSSHLQFHRLSVDHGTAFELYGKNIANPESLIFIIKTLMKNHYEKSSKI
jgi:4-hydroxythreonine-4-phosphate dehydrogenase